jgi:hypothetical protein
VKYNTTTVGKQENLTIFMENARRKAKLESDNKKAPTKVEAFSISLSGTGVL